MSGNKSNNKATYNINYDVSQLLKPDKIVINMEGQGKILLQNRPGLDYYDSVLNDSRMILKELLSSSDFIYEKASQEKWEELKNETNIGLLLKSPVEANTFAGLLRLNGSPEFPVKYYSSIVICPKDNKVYIKDESQQAIFEFSVKNIKNSLNLLIEQIAKQNTAYYIYLSNNFPLVDDMYGFDENAIAFADIAELPILSIEPEFDISTITTEDVIGLFDDDISRISVLDEAGGVREFTDREEERVRIDINGTLEYNKASLTSFGSEAVNLQEALSISAAFVENHFGFPEDAYVSDIVLSSSGNKPTYTIKYRYRYEGIPVIMEQGAESDAIEIEIVGNEVKSYKRFVWKMSQKDETIKVITIANVLDTITRHNQNEYMPKNEKIVLIEDIYIAYFERKNNLIPVWAVDVIIESNSGTGQEEQFHRKIIIHPTENGLIIDEQ